MQDILFNRREVLTSIAAAATLTALPKSSPATSAAACNFLVVGDWGRNGTNHQREVAVQMGKTAASAGSRCVFSVGDNFYENGVQSAADPQWRTSYEDIYSARSLQVPWYVALGNHDYRGVPQAQIDYAKTSPRWRMPSRYFKVPGADIGAPHLDLFVIDTSPLVHQYHDNVHSVIAENVAGQDVPAQLQWLDDQLAKSAAPWKLVFGHHTIHSGGSGHGDTPETKDLIEPLLQKHVYQRSRSRLAAHTPRRRRLYMLRRGLRGPARAGHRRNALLPGTVGFCRHALGSGDADLRVSRLHRDQPLSSGDSPPNSRGRQGGVSR
jgi:acid phosphatase